MAKKDITALKALLGRAAQFLNDIVDGEGDEDVLAGMLIATLRQAIETTYAHLGITRTNK